MIGRLRTFGRVAAEAAAEAAADGAEAALAAERAENESLRAQLAAAVDGV